MASNHSIEKRTFPGKPSHAAPVKRYPYHPQMTVCDSFVFTEPTTAQMEREQALQAASATREEAAGMRGELEALRVQNAALLNTLKPTIKL